MHNNYNNNNNKYKVITKYVDEITATTMQLKLEVRHTNRH
jgi:hypothetical protein